MSETVPVRTGRTMWLAEAATASWYDVALALLNVLQTVALAYLAADRHATQALRKQGYLTRRDDPPAP
jgi:hypothetical protein